MITPINQPPILHFPLVHLLDKINFSGFEKLVYRAELKVCLTGDLKLKKRTDKEYISPKSDFEKWWKKVLTDSFA